MKRVRMQYIACFLLAAAFAFFPTGVGCAAEETEKYYTENEWGYVDASMDISQGIPKDAEGALELIRERGALLVAMEPYYPPQEFIDPALEGQSQFVGADVELARLIAKKMGVELVLVPMDFTQVLPAVAEGTCDLAISALSFTPERAGRVEMSKGYHFAAEDVGSGILIRAADRDSIQAVQDLADKTIVVQSGSLQEVLGAENVLSYLEMRRLSSMQAVYQALIDGWADAAVVDFESAQIFIDNNPQFQLTLLPDVRFLLQEQFQGDRIAGKKDDLELMYFVNGVIDEVLTDNRYEAWYLEYAAYAKRLGL